MKKRHIPYYFFVLLYWVTGCLLLAAISKYTFSTLILFIDIEQSVKSLKVLQYVLSPYPFLEAIVLGSALGLTFIVSNDLANRIYSIRKLNFGVIIALKSFLFLVGVAVTLISFFVTVSFLLISPIKDIELFFYNSFARSFRLIVLIYISIMALALHFLVILARKFGLRTLIYLITGKYAEPKEEHKVFLFMDLRSSTKYGESLSHYKYSKLIRDCFSELNKLVLRYDAEIYQYVGDEVVLTWDADQIKSGTKPIDIYFAFQEQLKAKENYFQDKYNILPVFKAGAHVGKVTVSEIGDLKRELAYHGDAINTASRIQGACNQFEAQYLISENLINEMQVDSSPYHVSALGEVELKGKQQKVRVYAVNKSGALHSTKFQNTATNWN